MNTERLRITIKNSDGCYHCVSRIVGRQWLLGITEKAVFVDMLFRIAEFCGVEIYTFCVMDDHFHLLIKIPAWHDITDAELLRRVLVLYRKDDFLVGHFIEKLKERVMRADQLILPDPEFEKERSAMIRRMYNLSEFMKCLKQRFSIWYNRNHNREGTLYSDRFQSILIEDNPELLSIIAAYIDLNPVRAGICKNPAAYKWCGLGWKKITIDDRENSFVNIQGEVQIQYRKIIRDILSCDNNAAGENDRTELQRELEKHDEAFKKNHPVSFQTYSRSRFRMFVAGAIIGSLAFLEAINTAYESPRSGSILGPRSGVQSTLFSKKYFYRKMKGVPD